MTWFNNLKLGRKLLAGFLMTSVFIVIVGAIGIFNLSKIEKSSNKLYDENLRVVENLNTFDTNSMKLRLEIINLVESRDKNATANTIAAMKKLQDQNSTIINTYENSNLTKEEKNTLNIFTKQRKDRLDPLIL